MIFLYIILCYSNITFFYLSSIYIYYFKYPKASITVMKLNYKTFLVINPIYD